MKHNSFLRRNPAALVAVPPAFAVLTLTLLAGAARVFVTPYLALLEWAMTENASAYQAQDLMETAAIQPESDTEAGIPLSSITYPAEGDRYGTITIEGTAVNAPVYYGDTNAILNQGVGTYKDSYGTGIPGEGRTILLAGHNNTFFNDLQSVNVGDVVTIETHYGVYTYTVESCEILEYDDTSAYDFTRTDENLILYTCYPFDALGFTPQRYFVYASYTSGPRLDTEN